MAYEVQLGQYPTLNSNLAPEPAGHYTQDMDEIEVTRTPSFPNSTQIPAILSNVKIKRPDGTWASVVKIPGVHLRLPDGTWQIFT